MPGLRNLIGAVVGLAAVASALPALPRLNERALKMYEWKRQVTETGLPANLTDVDILQLYVIFSLLFLFFFFHGAKRKSLNGSGPAERHCSPSSFLQAKT